MNQTTIKPQNVRIAQVKPGYLMFIGNNAILVLDVKKSPGERFGNQFNWLNVTFLNLHMRHTYVLSQVDTDFLECYIPEDLPME